MEKKRNLTPKQKKFCLKYVETGNQIESYKYSYAAENMSYSSINTACYRLLKNTIIAQYVRELQDALQKEFIHTIEDSLKLDYEMIENYKFQMDILSNRKSTKRQLEVATKLGYYDKEKPIVPVNAKSKVVFELPSNNR